MEGTLRTARSVVGRASACDDVSLSSAGMTSRLVSCCTSRTAIARSRAMRRAHVVGDIVAWRDVLHEGPVPALAAAELRPCARSSSRRWRPHGGDGVEADLLARDERLGAAVEAGERVVLWFEHDLYDQLQLLQILAGLPDRPVGVELICIGSFPGRPGFAGLGELEPDELASLWPLRTPVVNEHVRAARAAWDVFRAPDPRGLARAATVAGRAAAVRRRRRCGGCSRSCPAPATASPAPSASCWPPSPRAPARASRRSSRRPRARRRRSSATRSRSTASRSSRRGPQPLVTGGRRALTDGGRRGARRPRRPRGAQRLRPLARRHAPARRRRAVALGRRSGARSSTP